MLAVDDLHLDVIKKTVQRGTRSISLTRKEFMLLQYLLRNHGAVLSRGKIMDHLWDMNTELHPKAVDMLVARLRRKIDMEGKPHLIHAVPGMGYKLDVVD